MQRTWNILRSFSRVVDSVPIYVMLPLEFPTMDENDCRRLVEQTIPHVAGASKCAGFMVDLWWGLCEQEPRKYTWCEDRYRALFSMCQRLGVKCQVVLGFHKCGGNVGDSVTYGLPEWVLARARELKEKENKVILYMDRHGYMSEEYISCGADEEPLFPVQSAAANSEQQAASGQDASSPATDAQASAETEAPAASAQVEMRSPLQCYEEFMNAFVKDFGDEFFGTVIHEVHIGMGPASELRYPSYPLTDGKWKFPGIGEFQCYDTFLMKDLEKALANQKFSEDEIRKCIPPRDTAGSYCDTPDQSEFFRSLYATPAGRFFLKWYGSKLLEHGERVLVVANKCFHSYIADRRVRLGIKVAGIHWWFKTPSHAAEMTAGYYHTADDPWTMYDGIAALLRKHGIIWNFTCYEMRDSEQREGKCSPEGLVNRVRIAAQKHGVALAAENALPRYDRKAYKQIVAQAKPSSWGISLPFGRKAETRKTLCGFTYLRLTPELLEKHHLREFANFVSWMQGAK
ncbi:probable beta-amylase [Cyanidioschyzon merolae strain 10D]|jgi:beta-amylase|uniref:Beta-amylase n=1 Tax=Cyanidioschyzon merolae (strain NIES-3377 / 10D) TaxID=280699 RepID=M1V812_CYAM1|nr:probable beta-amylase [Cyanidioschyzon merolae strain 10D]BAM80224.1 probable beta-amylase [Cyanidioschyzon merolae strain 10D]|eukprot:XP_005534831.1 probable beta-amylase [Cyanidioschyzon merolae strain 10D]